MHVLTCSKPSCCTRPSTKLLPSDSSAVERASFGRSKSMFDCLERYGSELFSDTDR